MEQWEKNYYISSIAGAANGSSLVVMSKGWIYFHILLWHLFFVSISVLLLFHMFSLQLTSW